MTRPPDDARFCTFCAAGLWFGVDVLQVQEVLRHQTMTQVPRSPEVVSGLLNLRGHIVTALDLRTRLELGDEGRPESPMNVVVRQDDATASLLVDAVGDVLSPDPTRWEPRPANLRGRLAHLTQGVYKLDDKILILLNLNRVLDLELDPAPLA